MINWMPKKNTYDIIIGCRTAVSDAIHIQGASKKVAKRILRAIYMVHSPFEANYTGLETTLSWNVFVWSFLTKTKQDQAVPSNIPSKIWPRSTRFRPIIIFFLLQTPVYICLKTMTRKLILYLISHFCKLWLCVWFDRVWIMLTEDLYVLCFVLLCQLLVPLSVSVCVCELASLFCVCFGENDHIGKVRAVV